VAVALVARGAASGACAEPVSPTVVSVAASSAAPAEDKERRTAVLMTPPGVEVDGDSVRFRC
jgi:hypothetical protein